MRILEKKESETLDEYILRASKEKDVRSLTWQQIAYAVQEEFDIIRSESWARKKARALEEKELFDRNDPKALDSMGTMVLKLKKERAKLAEERAQNNSYVRRLAREETIIDIAKYYADIMSSKKILPVKDVSELECNKRNSKEAILCLSDWHYGICCNNYWNVYNPEIAKERISQLLNDALFYIKSNKISKIHVLNLGDLIAGRIHLALRLESRIDVITQIMEVSEILAEFLNELANNVEMVEYYSCSDNHSRLEPNKADSLDLESLYRITDWYLSERLSNRCNNINVNKNVYGDDIITFTTMGHSIASMHGHKDSPNGCIDRISSMTRNSYDLIIMAHRHHFSMDENGQCRLVCNGSLMGTDTYAKDLRLNSKPSQTLIIVGEKNVCESIHILELD